MVERTFRIIIVWFTFLSLFFLGLLLLGRVIELRAVYDFTSAALLNGVSFREYFHFFCFFSGGYWNRLIRQPSTMS